MAQGAASARAQLGANVAGRHGARDVIRPSTEEESGRGVGGETGHGGEEGVARPDSGGEERTDGAAPEQPVGQVERTGPIPEPMEARDEGATMVESVVQPAPEVVQPVPEAVPAEEMPPDEEPEVPGLGQSEAPGQVAPSSASGAAGVDAGQGPPVEAERAMVQHGGTPGFTRNTRKKEEV